MNCRILAATLALLLAAPAFAQQNNFTPATPFAGAPVNRSTKNNSIKVTTGNTYQTVLAAQTATDIRQALTIVNNNTSDNCFVAVGTTVASGNTTSTNVTVNGVTMTSAQASILLMPGGSYTRYWPFVPSDIIVATCASNGDSLYVDVQ